MNKPAPMSDEQIYQMYNEPRSDAEMLEFARAIIAARDAQWEAMLAQPVAQQEHTCYPWGVCNCKAQPKGATK